MILYVRVNEWPDSAELDGMIDIGNDVYTRGVYNRRHSVFVERGLFTHYDRGDEHSNDIIFLKLY